MGLTLEEFLQLGWDKALHAGRRDDERWRLEDAALSDGTAMARNVGRMTARHVSVLLSECMDRRGVIPSTFLLALLESNERWNVAYAMRVLAYTDVVNRVLVQAAMGAHSRLRAMGHPVEGEGVRTLIAAWAGLRTGMGVHEAVGYMGSQPEEGEREAAERGEG